MTDQAPPTPLPPIPQAQLRFDPLCYGPNRGWLFRLFRRLGLRPGDHMLDIGCGFQPWTAIAAHEYGLRVSACDYLMSDGYFAEALPWLHYFHADVRTLERLPEKYDLIFCRGLNALIFNPDLKSNEAIRFRDLMVRALGENGALCLIIHSRNTGVQDSPRDWGNVTTAGIHAWLAGEFPHIELSRAWISRVLAARRPIAEPWRETPFARAPEPEGGWEQVWQNWWKRYRDENLWLRLLARISQHLWVGSGWRPDPDVFVLGEGALAADLAFVIANTHWTARVTGSGPTLPPTLPSDAFVFVLPGAALPEGFAGPHYVVTWQELLGRLAAEDLDMVGGDIDLDQIGRLATTLRHRRMARQMDAVRILPARSRARAWREAEQAAGAIVGADLPWRQLFMQVLAMLQKEKDAEGALQYCSHALAEHPEERYFILVERVRLLHVQKLLARVRAELPDLLASVDDIVFDESARALERLDLVVRFGQDSDRPLLEQCIRVILDLNILTGYQVPRFGRLLRKAQEAGVPGIDPAILRRFGA